MKKYYFFGTSQVIEQAKFINFPLVKAFKKQKKTIKEYEDKQIKAIENQEQKRLGTLKDIEFLFL